MYKVEDLKWEEFKEYILSNDNSIRKEFVGTMEKIMKPKGKITVADINDEKHLRVVVERDNGWEYTSEYYMVKDYKFQNLIK
jgi:hypothetical protein